MPQSWQPSHSAWCVSAKTEEDSKAGLVMTKARVKVGGVSPKYLRSSRQNFYSDRKDAYIQAIKLWNDVGKSIRDRIVVPMVGGVPPSDEGSATGDVPTA